MRHQAFFYAAGNLLQRAYPVAETLLLTLLLPVEDFGRWSWAASFYTGMMSVAHGGIPAATLRYAAVHRREGVAVLRLALRKLFFWMGGGGLGLFLLGWTTPVNVRWLVWAHVPMLIGSLVGETIRSYLRGHLQDRKIFFWQLLSSLTGLLVTGILTWSRGIQGAIWARLIQPVWGLYPLAGLLWKTFQGSSALLVGFGRFGWAALWGNLAMEAIFILPTWFLGWAGASPKIIAYWRWATVIPFAVRGLIAQVVMYFYPLWVQRQASSWEIYRRFFFFLHAIGVVGAFGLSMIAMVWESFPGEAYLPALPYYWGAVGVSYLWSTEALAVPNILSAKGRIHLFSRAYIGGLVVAVSFYGVAEQNLWMYLIGMGGAAVVASGIGLWYVRREGKA